MSRSRKHPTVTCTPQIDKNTAHKRVRREVKAYLNHCDLIDIDVCMTEADTRSLKCEDWGTKFGFDCYDEEYKEDIEKYSRK